MSAKPQLFIPLDAPPPLTAASGALFVSPTSFLPRAMAARGRPANRLAFGFGPRFYLLLFFGLVWLAPAWWDRRFLFGMLLWDLLVLGLWCADLAGIPRARDFEVLRIWKRPPSLSSRNEIEVEVRNLGRAPVRIQLVDDVPPALCPAPAELELFAAPGHPGRGSYPIFPIERGDARIGKISMRVESRFRIAERWVAAEVAQAVRVYPNLEEGRRQTIFLIRSRQVELEKRLKRRRGQGREFESLREYRQGDEMRDICWTASARRRNLVTKVHQIERSQAVWTIVDTGRLLRARVAQPGGEAALEKLDYAVNAALTLAHVALFSGDRVGLIAYGRRLQQRLNAARGTPQLRQLAESLAQVRSEPFEGDHALAAEELLRVQKRRGLVVWLTDLAETSAMPEVIEGALRLAPRHLVLFVVLAQPDLERLASATPATQAEMYRSAAAQQMVHRRDLLLRGLRQQGVLTVQVEPGRLSTAVINHYLEIKERSLL